MARSLANKLCLGTATFGLDYGIANTTGRVLPEDAHRILQTCLEVGIDTWDTAAAYGESERVLGDFLKQSKHYPNLISKLSNSHSHSLTIEQIVYGSLNRLNMDHLYGYLIHNFEDYDRDEGIFQELLTLREKGIVKKVGFSLYLPGHLEFILNKGIPLDIVQIPYSIFDRRFDDYFPILHEHGIEIHLRSIFLQGLLFLPLERLTGLLKKAKSTVMKLSTIARETGWPVGAIALNFVLLNPHLDKVVVGVNSWEQLHQNLEWLTLYEQVQTQHEDWSSLAIRDEDVLLPYNWVTQ